MAQEDVRALGLLARDGHVQSRLPVMILKNNKQKVNATPS